MKKEHIGKAIRDISLALSANHGTIAIDDPKAETTEISWRVDNSKEIVLLDKLAKHLGVGND